VFLLQKQALFSKKFVKIFYNVQKSFCYATLEKISQFVHLIDSKQPIQLVDVLQIFHKATFFL